MNIFFLLLPCITLTLSRSYFSFFFLIPSPQAFCPREWQVEIFRSCTKGTNYPNMQPMSILTIQIPPSFRASPALHQSLILQASSSSPSNTAVINVALVFVPSLTLCFLLVILLVFSHLSISLPTHKSDSGTRCHSLSDGPEGYVRTRDPPAHEHGSDTWRVLDASIVYANPQTHLLQHSHHIVSADWVHAHT